jgi:hypothetical protein
MVVLPVPPFPLATEMINDELRPVVFCPYFA